MSLDVLRLTRPVFLVGFMGAGKTSVARKLARMCGAASIDTDAYAQRFMGRSIESVFSEEGEEVFRDTETMVLRTLCAGDPAFISCGGGLVCREENRRLLAQTGYTVYLRVTAEEARERISRIETRPLFRDIEQATALCAQREPLYLQVADYVLETAGRTTGAVARDLRVALLKRGVLCRQPR